MPSPEYPAPDMHDTDEWLSFTADARTAAEAIRRTRRSPSGVVDIELGPTGRRALVGDDDTVATEPMTMTDMLTQRKGVYSTYVPTPPHTFVKNRTARFREAMFGKKKTSEDKNA